MPIVPPIKLAQLQKNVHNIRNVCVLAHVDHGKTTLSDALLATNGIISNKLAGKVKYLDSREDEQERGITMESSGISLYYKLFRKANSDNDESKKSPVASEYLINLIDSPGHVDFSSEVASAARLADGALVLVDVVEGVCTQTISVLRQAWIENVHPVLFLNKIDRLIVEWRMTPNEAYLHIQQLIEQVNAVLAGFWEGDRLAEDSRKLEEAKEKWKQINGEDAPMADWYLEEKDDSQIYFSPDKDNVLFGSAIDGWAFSIGHFARVFAKKLGIPSAEKLQSVMWGNYYFDPKNRQRILTHKQFSKVYGPGKTAAALPLFAQLCLAPIWQVYESVIIDHDQERIDKVIATLDLKVLPRDRRTKDHRVLLTAIMQGWLPLAQTCMVAIVDKLPSPPAAQPLRLPPLVQGKAQSVSGCRVVEPKNDAERALFSCTSSSSSPSTGSVPLVAYVGKIISIQRECLPEFSDSNSQRDRMVMSAEEMRARGRDAVRRELASARSNKTPIGFVGTPLSSVATSVSGSGTGTPLQEEATVPLNQGEVASAELTEALNEKLNVAATDLGSEEDPDANEDEIIIGFGRIYSGTIRVGDKIWAMQPKYNVKNPQSRSFLKPVTVKALYMLMGREFVSLPEVPAGNIFGIRGVAGAILKSGTLASDFQRCPNLAAMHSEVQPILRVAIEPMNPQHMTNLARGLELLNQADPCVQVISQATGERVLVTAGELHLERCLKDLRERFAKCAVHVSEPIVPFREGIVRQNAQPGVILGEVGASGHSLAIIPKTQPGSNNTNNEPVSSSPFDTQSEESGNALSHGEVKLTTANGMATVTVQVESLPEKTTKFLLRHGGDIQRIVKLSSSQRSARLNAAAEALANNANEDTEVDATVNAPVPAGTTAADGADCEEGDGNDATTRLPKPSNTSELGPWIQSRLRSTFGTAKGWEPNRVEYITDKGIRKFGPRRTGPNVLVYSKEMLEQCSKPTVSWFRKRTRGSTGTSSAVTPMLSDTEDSDDEDNSTGRRKEYTFKDFEEAVNTGFQLATNSGPLCCEPMAGVAVTIKSLTINQSEGGRSTSGLSGQIITVVRDAIKMGFVQWSPRLYLAMYTCDIQTTSDVLGKVYGVINRRRGRILHEEMREGTPYFTIQSAIPVVESFGFADDVRKRSSGAAIPLLIYRGFEQLDEDPFWIPTTEEELEDLGEKADRENVAKKYMDKVRKRKGLFVERKIIEHAEKQRTLKR